MKSFEEYFDKTKHLEETADSLISLDPENNQTVNDFVINFVVNYLLQYLEIESRDVDVIRNLLNSKLDQISGLFSKETLYFARTGKADISTDMYPLKCVFDIRSTCALVKEIIFGLDADKHIGRPEFTSVDLGSGTGILMAATYIRAKRSQISNVLCYGIDRNPCSLEGSERVLSILDSSSFRHVEGDLLDDETYEDLVPIKEVNMIVAEIINNVTPRLKIGPYEVSPQFEKPEQEAVFRKYTGTLDPYAQVLDLLINHIPKFHERVKSGEITLFPDAFSGLYKPNHKASKFTLTAATGKPEVHLTNVGPQEFGVYDPICEGTYRW